MSLLESLYTIETYFEAPYYAMDEKTMASMFEAGAIEENLESGMIEKKCVQLCANKCPYFVYCLSDKGRRFCEQVENRHYTPV